MTVLRLLEALKVCFNYFSINRPAIKAVTQVAPKSWFINPINQPKVTMRACVSNIHNRKHDHVYDAELI